MNNSIRVICATGMPEGVLVWVDPRAAYTVVYADASLYRGGHLTEAGVREIGAALHQEAAAV
ncbi:hypothetical protein [Streptomyces sp. NRRL F-5630]|uniref:hypothetical protein n=1 Tax=Streptomyces sp. NRRL F-5630 TaxID=1463864 RepID=UPI003EC089F4